MNTISVGIDIAKDKFDAAFFREDNSSKIRTFSNTKVGIKSFIQCLQKQETASSVPCVIESTGMYHLPVAIMVTNAGYRVNCINPIITKSYQRSSIRNAKTDEIDAVRLATIGLREPNLPIFEANYKAIEIRKIASYISRLEVAKQRLKMSGRSMKSIEEITGLSVNLEYVESAIKLIQKQIDELSKVLVERTPDNILQIADKTKGVSREGLSIIFAFIGDKQFTSRDSLVAFLGLDITPRQSGTWRGKGKISKRGNGYARKILFQTAWALKQYNQPYSEYYKSLRDRGKNYKTSLLAVGRKFLRFLYSQHWKTKLD